MHDLTSADAFLVIEKIQKICVIQNHSARLAHLQPHDIAATVLWVAQTPAHVNINNIELMPTCQSWAALAVHRQ